MADRQLRRNLELAFHPGEDFPSATLLIRTLARLDVVPKSRYRVSHPIAALGMIGLLLLAAVGLLRLHLWVVASHSTPSHSSQLAPAVSRGGPWSFGGLAMITTTIGWDNGNPFMRTTDGGAHWTNVTPQGAGRNVDDYYLDDVHAWVTDYSGFEAQVGGNVTLPNAGQLVTFLTVDGGRSWERGTPLQIKGRPMQTQQYYVDPKHGWLLLSLSDRGNLTTAYSDNLYKTEDGGLHWQLIAVKAAPPSWQPDKFYCYQWCRMTFISPSTGWIIGSQDEPTYVVTHDGGSTWNQWNVPLRGSGLNCPCFAELPTFLDQDHGWLLITSPASGAEALLVTADTGRTWTDRQLPSVAPGLVGFYDADHGWAIGESAAALQLPLSATPPTVTLSLYRTSDGGRSWSRVVTALQLQSKDGQVNGLYFLNDAIGFAFRTPVSGQGWELLRTTNGGHTWSLVARNL